MMDFAGFDWDAGNRKKCEKHGVSIDEIESLFERELKIAPDPVHSSSDEERFNAIGKTVAGRNVLLVFTLRRRRGGTLLRPISARYMHQKEVAYYEKETSGSAK